MAEFGLPTHNTQFIVPESNGNSIFLDQIAVELDGKYGNKLGEGTFATVYEGKFRGQTCAVKVFKENVLNNEGEHDIVILCNLKAPNIVQIHGCWFYPYKYRTALSLVMDLCDISLHKYIRAHKKGGIPKRDKLKILHDVTNAMIYLHSQHIVHGDLRSPNVLLVNTRSRVESSDEQPQITAKVADFGLTQLIDPKTLTRYTTTFADVDYLPPEAIAEEKFKDRKHVRLTFSVDVFCFGPLAIELACMEFPKPVAKVERKKGQVVKVRDEIERRNNYLKRIDFSERMYTDLIVAQCMADKPEERGSFLYLQLIIEDFQKKMQERPNRELLEEQQAKISDMRRKMEEDAKKLAETEILREKLENMSKDNKELQVKLEHTEKALERLNMEKTELGSDEKEIQRIKEDWNSVVAAKDMYYMEAVEAKNLLQRKADKAKQPWHSAEEEQLSLSSKLQKLKQTKTEAKKVDKPKKEELFTKLSDEEQEILSESLDKQLMETTERANITELNVRMLEARLKEEEEKLRAAEEEKTKLSTRLTKAEESLEDTKEIQSQLREDKDKLRRDNYELRESLERHLHLIEQKDRTMKTLQDECERHVQSLQAMEEKQRELTIRLNKQTKHFKQKETEWRAEIEGRDKMRRDNYELRESLEMYLNRSEQKDRTIKTLQDVREKHIQSLQAMEEEQKELKIKLKKQRKCLRQIEIEWKPDPKGITRILEPALLFLETEDKELQRKVVSSEEVIRQKEQEIVELKRSKDTLSVEVQEKEREIAKLKKKLEAEIASREENQQRMKEYQATSEKMERLAGTLQSELSELTQLFTEQEASATAKQEELKEMLEVANKERITFVEQMDQEERIQAELQKQLDKQRERWESEVSKADQLTERIHYLRIDLMKECVRSTELQAQLDNVNRNMKREISGLQGEISHLEEENIQLKGDKRRFDLEKSNFEEDNKMLSEKCDTYKVERDRMCEEKENLLVKLDQLKKKIETLEISSDIHGVDAIDTVVPGPLAHETELMKFCWIPFGIQTLTVGQEGGHFPLQPQSKGLSEDRGVIMLEVPENAVNTAVCDELCIRYGVIVYGPFDVPEGYQLGSMAVYIYFEEDHAVKPVLLHLPHWSGKDGESSLKSAVAPHRLEEGEEKYKFRLTEDGDFHSTEGSVVIAIDGHCSLFAKAFRGKAGSLYYATPLEMEQDTKAITRIAVTYNTSVWIEIFEKYCRGFKVGTPQPFSFESEVGIRGKLYVSEGKGWTATVSGQLLPSYILYENHQIESPKQLERAVINKCYPPSLTCEAVFSSELKQFGIPIQVRVHVDGTNHSMDAMVFTCRAYEERQQERPVPVGYSMFSPTSSEPSNPMALPTKQLTVQNLMPYLPELAPLGLQIAGHLDLTDEWASLEISHQDPLDRLQKLFTKWLGDSETEKCPHTWDYFVSVVRAVGKGKLADKIVADVYQTSRDTAP